MRKAATGSSSRAEGCASGMNYEKIAALGRLRPSFWFFLYQVSAGAGDRQFVER
jgi:hypothetical protein